MKKLFVLAVFCCVSFLWAVEASARPCLPRKAAKAAVRVAVRPVGKVLKVVKVLLPPYRNR